MGGLVLQLNLNTGQTHPVNYLLQRCPLYREQRERFCCVQIRSRYARLLGT